METVRELEDGEEGKWIDSIGQINTQRKLINKKLTVDSEGFLHSINDEPAYYHEQTDKYKKHVWWMNHGYRHRLTGPSYVSYDENGEIYIEVYYIEGKLSTKDEIQIYINRMKMLNEII